MYGWSEVADGVFQARYQPFDVTVAVVRGQDGLLVVDTRASHRQGLELRADLANLGGPVRYVVNTHAHFDHMFGNDCFGAASDRPTPIYAHDRAPAHLERYGAVALATGDPELDGTVLTVPTDLVGDVCHLELGDRAVELRYLGRGHTDNDLVLHVADARTWLVGDLIEESGPPMCGKDGFPLEWAATLDALLALVGPDDLMVPGHGAVVGRDFAVLQQRALATMATVIRALHAAGVPVHEAVGAGGSRWPFPSNAVADAAQRGYAQLAGVDSPH